MPVLFVASTGGHLAQLHRLAGRIAAPGERRWVTFDSPQSRALLAEEPHRFVTYIRPRDYVGVVAEARRAIGVLIRTRPRLVVSTGSAIALSYLPAARSLGIPCAYIESAARATGPSLTGRLVARVPGVQLCTQYRALADDSWRYVGSVFDDFALDAQPLLDSTVRRIFVTLGTIPYPFARALDAVARVLPIDCTVSCQVGSTTVGTPPGESAATMPPQELRSRIAEADVVVAHAGIGSALDILQAGKVPILLPRRAANGEHIDDHQEQIARRLADLGLAICKPPEDLTVDDLHDAARRRVTVTPSAMPITLDRR